MLPSIVLFTYKCIRNSSLTLKGEKRIAPVSLSVPCDHISSLLPVVQCIPATDDNYVNALQQMQFSIIF